MIKEWDLFMKRELRGRNIDFYRNFFLSENGITMKKNGHKIMSFSMDQIY